MYKVQKARYISINLRLTLLTGLGKNIRLYLLCLTRKPKNFLVHQVIQPNICVQWTVLYCSLIILQIIFNSTKRFIVVKNLAYFEIATVQLYYNQTRNLKMFYIYLTRRLFVCNITARLLLKISKVFNQCEI